MRASIDNEKTKQREIGALSHAMDELKLKKALILAEDIEEEIRLKGKVISVRPIYKWLLE